MNIGLINVTGIVVGKRNFNEYFIWCQESFPGKDGVLTVETQKPVKIGDWVHLKFTAEEFQKYFPNPKNPDAGQFRTTNYTPVRESCKTTVDGKTIRIQLELSLLENQREIHHDIFGTIHNNHNVYFGTGDHMVTIRRVRPQYYMKSVWVLDSVDPLPLEVNLIGIVGGSDNNYWYVWTKERPVGWDITIRRGGATLVPGSWVRVTVPRDKLKNDYFLASEKYTVIPEIHETEVVNKTIGLVLQCHISDGTLIQHPFVGPIVNENFDIKSEGLYEIRIVRKKPKTTRNGEKSVWCLDGEPMLSSRPPSRNKTPVNTELTGIIVAKNFYYLFVWCKERLPGFDVKIRKSENTASLDLTDYIKFTVSDEQKTIFFPPRMPENGHYPQFELSQYRKVSAEFPTTTSGVEKTINVELRVEIQYPTYEDIHHDFVGLIINNKNLYFETPGTYRITILRFLTNQALPKSVWYLKHRELISNSTGSAQNLTPSMENLSLAPRLKPILKYSHLQSQMNKLGSQSDNLLCAPPPQRSRQDSQSTIMGHSTSRPRSLSRSREEPPIPAPRTILSTPTINQRIHSEAIILNIVKTDQGKEDIHVWIFDKLKQGFLNLQFPAEQNDLKNGKIFGAEFTDHNGKWKAFKVNPGTVQTHYLTRNSRDIEILVRGKVPAGHPSHEHQKVEVKNFGDVLDIRRQIPHDFDPRDPFWIKRSKINNQWEWIVVEVVDTNRNNRNSVMSNGLLPA